MSITVRYFAAVREQLGPSETLSWADTAAHTVGELRQWLICRSPAHAAALDTLIRKKPGGLVCAF